MSSSGPHACRELPENKEVLIKAMAWHVSKRVLRDNALGDWSDVRGPFSSMLVCVEQGRHIWSGAPAREGYNCS